MKKIIIGAIASICLIGLTAALVKKSGKTKSANIADSSQNQNASAVNGLNQQQSQKADKIEVVHFHATKQCYSCKTVGEYALKTIKEKFPEEYQSGKITFKDINGELPESRDMVMKYRAAGSSLFINAVKNGQDNIEEDTTVWRLISNENKFVDYFQEKIGKILGG